MSTYFTWAAAFVTRSHNQEHAGVGCVAAHFSKSARSGAPPFVCGQRSRTKGVTIAAEKWGSPSYFGPENGGHPPDLVQHFVERFRGQFLACGQRRQHVDQQQG